MITLYNFWRSGPSFRVRIGLALKGVAYDYVAVNILAGEQDAPDYLARNPQGLVPTLEVDGVRLTQSPAILEWLDETYPDPPFLPGDRVDRAHVRAMAALIACETHPLNNTRVHRALRRAGLDQDGVNSWSLTWIELGFTALEALIGEHAPRGRYCFGDTPTMADIYLAPQILTYFRFAPDLAKYPRLAAIHAALSAHPAFIAAHPSRQPDGHPL
jgi:maleylacetoacetate isomerase